MRYFSSVFVVLFLFSAFSFQAFADFCDVEYADPSMFHENVQASFHLNDDIKWLEENDVVEGYSDNTFRPDASINRAEFLKILYRALGYERNKSFTYRNRLGRDTFSDLPNGSFWYQDYVSQAYEDGVLDGYSDGTFGAGNTINFAEASKILSNMVFGVGAYIPGAGYGWCNLEANEYSDEWFYEYVALLDGSCIYPDDLWQREGYHPSLELTRGDMANMIYRAITVRDNSDYLRNPVTYTDNIFPNDLSDE